MWRSFWSSYYERLTVHMVESDGSTECFYSENFQSRQKVTVTSSGQLSRGGTNVNHFERFLQRISQQKNLAKSGVCTNSILQEISS